MKLLSKNVSKIVGAHDTISALLIEKCGLDGIWVSGFGYSLSRKGKPDASILSISELIDSTRNISDVTNIPIVVDMDSGYGNAVNVFFYAKSLYDAGASYLCIEDNIFPKCNSFFKGVSRKLVSSQEMCGKIKAAKDSVSEIGIIARNEGLIAGLDMNEVLDRSYAYEEAGADLLVIHGYDWERLEEFLSKWKGKIGLMSIPTKMPHIPFKKFEEHDFRVVVYANQLLRKFLKVSEEVLQELKTNGLSKELDENVGSMEVGFDLVNMERLMEFEHKYF